MEESDNPYTPLLQAIQSPFLSKPLSVAVKSVLAAINVANIVLGSVYINGCPGQRLIPYYLIVLGVGSLLLLSLTCLPCGDGRDPPRTTLGLLCAQGALALFLFAFFIAGNVWIYSLYSEPWDSAGDPKWCNRILYLYAFWVTTFFHMCFLLLIIAFLCIFVCLCVLKSSLSSRSQTA